MRFASVDNRSRSMWLLAGLGVLTWAVFSVFFGGSSAHADGPPAHPSHSQSQQSAQGENAQKHAQKQNSQSQRAHAQPRQQPISKVLHKAAPVQRAVASQKAAAQKAPDAPQTQPSAAQPSARSLQKQAKNAITRVAEPQNHDRQNARAWGHRNADAAHAIKDQTHKGSNQNHHAHSRHASPHAAQASAPQHLVTRAQHQSPAPTAAPTRAVPIAQAVAIVPTVASDLPAEGSPAESHGFSAQHPPATPLTASSTAPGQTAPAGDVPGTVKTDDLLGLLLAAEHADDDVLPTGPVSTTDSSPD